MAPSLQLSALHSTIASVRFKIHYPSSLLLIINSTTILSVQTQREDAAEPAVSDMSMSLGEMDCLGPLDVSLASPSTNWPSSPGSGSG